MRCTPRVCPYHFLMVSFPTSVTVGDPQFQGQPLITKGDFQNFNRKFLMSYCFDKKNCLFDYRFYYTDLPTKLYDTIRFKT